MRVLVLSFLLAVVLLPSISYAIDDPALVFYCAFEEGSGDITKDQVSGLEGFISGATWTDNGKIGGALEFAASADNVEFPADPVLDITDGLTMEAWAYPNQVQGDAGLFGRRTAGNVGGYCMQWNSGKFETWLHQGGWQGTRGAQSIVPDPEEWHHVASVFTGDKLIQYIDGEVDTELAVGAIDSVEEVFRIGQAQTGLETMYGIIDEVAIYTRALTEDEIKTDMASGVIPAAVSPYGNLATTWGSIKK